MATEVEAVEEYVLCRPRPTQNVHNHSMIPASTDHKISIQHWTMCSSAPERMEDWPAGSGKSAEPLSLRWNGLNSSCWPRVAMPTSTRSASLHCVATRESRSLWCVSRVLFLSVVKSQILQKVQGEISRSNFLCSGSGPKEAR